LTNDIYIRFKSFPNGEALKKEVERLQPVKIDIGAVYSVKVKKKRKNG
jgi:DNA primase small subunit